MVITDHILIIPSLDLQIKPKNVFDDKFLNEYKNIYCKALIKQVDLIILVFGQISAFFIKQQNFLILIKNDVLL